MIVYRKNIRITEFCAVLSIAASLGACSSTKQKDAFKVSAHPKQAQVNEYSSDLELKRSHNQREGASLWNSGPDSLFGDRRARKTGDIVTVVIELDEEAEIQNSLNTQRDNEENFSVSSLLGLNNVASRILPAGSSLNPGVDIDRTSSQNGSGNISRQEKITLRVAAIVTDILPNGHMIVEGTQMIRVNQETRDLSVAGIIRTEDISRQNTVTYDKIAEARVSYGGQGQVSNAVSRRSGNSFLNKIIPF